MKSSHCTAVLLILALAASLACSPALANDFIQPSPVPSSRQNIKPKATTKTSQTAVNNFVLNKKIVKTTKATGTTTTPATRGPGAL